MKLALGMMITHGEAPYLRLHLPIMAQAIRSVVIVIDPHEDLKDELRALDDAPFSLLTTIHREFENDWAAQFNAVIEHAERCGYDAILRLDPDEAMFPADINTVRDLLATHPVWHFPRFNFWGDRLHYACAPNWYPDWQVRAFKLNRDYRYGGQHHEGLIHPGVESFCAPAAIFHYGWASRQGILNRDFHYLQVAREKEGLPPLTERPADRAFPTQETAIFEGSQPLDPNVVGLYAPWSE